MFKSKFIRDNRGSLVGRIDEDDFGARGYDSRGSYVGRYDRHFDHTYDSMGRAVTITGDALASPIFGRKR